MKKGGIFIKIEVFTQSAIKLTGHKIIYFDPFKINSEYHDADYLFITHDHYDHYDEDSIQKVMKASTKIIAPKILQDQIQKITNNNLIVEPNQEYELPDCLIRTVPAYNLDKPFHPKSSMYVGYILTIDNTTYYVMGDTDNLEENKSIKTDICFVPIGGYYTMNVEEASAYINYIHPKIAIPIHYGSIVGDINLAQKFQNLIDKDIQVNIYIKEEK